MRAALLPAGGDPFVNAYWLRHYAQLWADEVDELRIVVCGQNDPGVVRYMLDRVNEAPHARVEFFGGRTDHGAVMRYLVDQTSADHIVLLEDDAFVRHPGVVNERFDRIVGLPRCLGALYRRFLRRFQIGLGFVKPHQAGAGIGKLFLRLGGP